MTLRVCVTLRVCDCDAVEVPEGVSAWLDVMVTLGLWVTVGVPVPDGDCERVPL